MSSSVVLLSSKSEFLGVHCVSLESIIKDSDGAGRLCRYSSAYSSLMAGSCFSMNRLISTISCRDTTGTFRTVLTDTGAEATSPAPTSGQALWGRPRYDLKVMLAGLMRLFIFSAVWLPNTKGTRGSASPWHCRTRMSLLALLADAWGKKRLGLELSDYDVVVRYHHISKQDFWN